MGFASEMQDVANELLGEFDESNGRIVLVKVGGDPVWNETLGEMVIPASSDIPLRGVTVAFSAAQINGTTTENTERTEKFSNLKRPVQHPPGKPPCHCTLLFLRDLRALRGQLIFPHQQATELLRVGASVLGEIGTARDAFPGGELALQFGDLGHRQFVRGVAEQQAVRRIG